MTRTLARAGCDQAVVVAAVLTSFSGSSVADARTGFRDCPRTVLTRDPASKEPGFLTPDFCRPLEERLAQARELLGKTPPSTPHSRAPHAILLWFRTDAPGVDIPPRERAKAPASMSIILQYQYRNLVVTSESVRVTVRFKGVWSRIAVPWDALIGVFDQTAGIKIYLRECGRPSGTLKADSLVSDLLRLRA